MSLSRRSLVVGSVTLTGGAIVLAQGFGRPDISAETLIQRYGLAPSKFLPLPRGTVARYRDDAPASELPVLLLLHGASVALESWDPWVARLGDRWRIIRVDL